MKYKIESAPLWQAKYDVLVCGVFHDEEVASALKSVDASLRNDMSGFLEKLTNAAKDEGFAGKSAQSMSLPTYGEIGAKRLLLVGLGSEAAFEPAVMRKLAANMGRRLSASEKTTSVCFTLRQPAKGKSKSETVPADCLQAIIEGWILGCFAFHKYKTANKEDKRADISQVALAGWTGTKEQFQDRCNVAECIATATNFARGLIAEPASYMTPTRLAQEAQRIANEYSLHCEIIDQAGAEKLGMGSFLGVARGAKEPAKFIALKYEGAKAKRTIALVGKGITFDSGGLSLKPAQSMEHMKYDMSGAAAVLGAMQVVGKLKPAVRVLGIIAATENMPGDGALHPGDVLTAMNGKTIEVNNTDAEGRLVLADALTYACKQGADEIIDLATLTGAIVSALGRAAAGVMGTDQALIDLLIKAGARAGEKLWQMPLFDEYKEGLKSDIADLKNAGSRGEAGSSSAAMFLREFVDGKPWAHLDMCGPAWLEKDRDECNKGGTAFGVRTLSYYLLEGNNASK